MQLDGLMVGEGTVLPEHIDYNGHMNVVHYRAAFDLSTDGLFAHLGLGPDDYTARTGATLMVVEEHTRYHAELSEGERYRILGRLVGHSAKKLHYLLAMENLDRGVLAATHEELALHVDLAARRSSPLPRPPWPPPRPSSPPRPTSRPHPTWGGSSPRDVAPLEPFLQVPVADGAAACRRTAGSSGRPIPWPSKSSANVTRDRAPPSSASTVTVAPGRIGPSTPRTAQLRGGLSSVTSWVIVRSTPPIRRVVVNLAPTPGGSSPSKRTRTTSRCHSANREGSQT